MAESPQPDTSHLEASPLAGGAFFGWTLQRRTGDCVHSSRAASQHRGLDGLPGKDDLLLTSWGTRHGNPPLNEDGMYCIQGGRPYLDKLKPMAAHCKAIIAWGSCASWGCVQAARPNPTQAVPIHKVIHDKPIVKVPGCPPTAEVMTGVITYMVTFDRLPELDRQGRPKMFYGQRLHDKCYRRSRFDAGQFVEWFDDEGARKGYCLYKVGCKGPTTYNACSTLEWNDGLSWPLKSGHGMPGPPPNGSAACMPASTE